MEDLILEVLKENGIETYLLVVDEEESSELFFIKKNLDMKRAKKVTNAFLTVYRDFEKDGKHYRGNADCMIDSSHTKEEISEKIKSAYVTASFVPNEMYEIAPQVKQELQVMDSDMSTMSLGDAALKLVNALYEEDHDDKAFINSSEIFVNRLTRHVRNSNGVDVSFMKYSAEGEFVVQCKEPEDVETHQTFAFDNLECEQLAKQVKRTIETTKDRAVASDMPKSGKYDVILSDKYVSTLLKFYAERANGRSLYQGYSDFAISESVQGDAKEIKGDALNMTFLPTNPYSREGLQMKKLPFIKDGVLQNMQSNCRYASYLKLAKTGEYRKLYCEPGKLSFEDMKKQPGLYVVNFSDFQMDSMGGYFGGEIRLAYLNDGNTVKLVTGGSVNGSIFDAQKDFAFSKEMQSNSKFVGPYAVRIKDVSVAGA